MDKFIEFLCLAVYWVSKLIYFDVFLFGCFFNYLIFLYLQNIIIRRRVGVILIAETIVESRLRWFDHVQRRELDEPVWIVDQMVWNFYKRERGRSKRTLNDIIQWYQTFWSIIYHQACMTTDRAQWHRVIHVANHT